MLYRFGDFGRGGTGHSRSQHRRHNSSDHSGAHSVAGGVGERNSHEHLTMESLIQRLCAFGHQLYPGSHSWRVLFVFAVSSVFVRCDYSQRKATSGSTLAARRAGSITARAATTNISKAATARVRGSVGLTPNKRDAIKRVTASDAGTPSAIPPSTSHRLSLKTIRSTPMGVAPSARRIPISLVRRATV